MYHRTSPSDDSRTVLSARSSITFPTESKREQIDLLLTEAARAMQLMPEHREHAERGYSTLGDHLDRPESALHRFQPRIYAQGSMAHGTTTKPIRRDEFDLDAVVELAFYPGTALELFGLLRQEIANKAEYVNRIEVLKRCVRIKFPGQFHIDVLPARRDLGKIMSAQDTYIEIPDRKLRDWISSNPKGFCAWFEGRCDLSVKRLLEARNQEPLPDDQAVEVKAILKQVVQILKRQRCVEFADMEDTAPRSIVLTTLAGHAYTGETSLFAALLAALDGFGHWIDSACGVLEVLNPTNSEECFSEAWRANPASYREFVTWVRLLRARIAALEQMSLPEIGRALEELFGTSIAKQAVSAFTERMNASRENGRLRMSPSARLTTTAAGIVTPAHRFHGKR